MAIKEKYILKKFNAKEFILEHFEGVPIRAIAEVLNVSYPTIQRILSGGKDPSIKTVEKMLASLGYVLYYGDDVDRFSNLDSEVT